MRKCRERQADGFSDERKIQVEKQMKGTTSSASFHVNRYITSRQYDGWDQSQSPRSIIASVYLVLFNIIYDWLSFIGIVFVHLFYDFFSYRFFNLRMLMTYSRATNQPKCFLIVVSTLCRWSIPVTPQSHRRLIILVRTGYFDSTFIYGHSKKS